MRLFSQVSVGQIFEWYGHNLLKSEPFECFGMPRNAVELETGRTWYFNDDDETCSPDVAIVNVGN